MIRNVQFRSLAIEAGDHISLFVDATYPIEIVIKCFITNPPPTRFANCEESGIHVLEIPKEFSITTSPLTFKERGEIEFKITDAQMDQKTYRVKVVNREYLGGNERRLATQ